MGYEWSPTCCPVPSWKGRPRRWSSSSWPPPPAHRTGTWPPSCTCSPGAPRSSPRARRRHNFPEVVASAGSFGHNFREVVPIMKVIRPRYGDASLADVIPGVLSALGLPGVADPLGLAAGPLAGVRRVAVLLVDGLGRYQLPLAAPYAPALTDVATGRLGAARVITSGFPSTTPVSLVSVGTGVPPGAHGVLGFNVRVPGTDRVLSHIQW